MKTVTALILTTVIATGFTTSASANSITDTISEAVSTQLTELSANIRQQAKSALEQTATELFFSSGSKQAEQSVTQTTKTTDTDKE